MATERIDIQVTDKGADKAAKNLRSIATNAEQGANYVERLRDALNALPATQLKALGTSSKTVAADLKKISANVVALESDLNSISSRATSAASAFNTLASAQQHAASAMTAASRATADSTSKMNAASAASNNLGRAQRDAAGSAGDLAARADRLRSALDPLHAAQSQFNAELAEARTLFTAGAINARTYLTAIGSAQAKLDAAKIAQDKYNNSLRQVGGAAKLAGHHQANLVAQINDIGVSLASGQNPFIVMLQQGSQLQDLSMRVEGGFKTLATATWRLLAPFAAVAAMLGIAYATFSMWQDSISDDAGLKEYAKTLGLTKDELKDLENVTVTAGDIMKGTWITIVEALNLEGPLRDLKNGVVDAIQFIWEAFKAVAFAIQAGWIGAYRSVITIWNQFPAAFKDIFAQAVNGAISILEGLANSAISVLNSLGGNFESVTLKRMENANAGAARKMGSDIVDNHVKAYKEVEANYNKTVQRIAENSQKVARDRLARDAAAMIADRSDKKAPKVREDKTEENRAHALAMVNLQLDNELSRMKLLKDERAIAQRMDQVEQALAQKKIKLNDAEKLAIENKIKAIEAYRDVQVEMDRIYQEIVGPQNTYNAALAASKQLLDTGKISLEQYQQALARATEQYKEATDPLHSLNQQIESQQRLLGLYGKELKDATYLEQIRQKYQKRGDSIYDASTGKLKDEVAAILAKNAALRDQQFINSQLSAVLEPILEQNQQIETQAAVNMELERLRQEDLISEDAYYQAKLALDLKYNEARLSATSDLFGALASVTAKGQGAIGAISKAAAIAQATIDGYLAVQKALTTLPPPANFVAAAAVAVKTGANIAGILSTNVGSFATGGQFMVGGRDGVDKNNINMNVTKGERVTVETPAQQRENDAASGDSGSPSVNVPVRVVAQFDPKMALDALDTAAGERVVISMVERNPAVFQRLLGSR